MNYNKIKCLELCRIIKELPEIEVPKKYKNNITCVETDTPPTSSNTGGRGHHIEVKCLEICLCILDVDENKQYDELITDRSLDNDSITFKQNTICGKENGFVWVVRAQRMVELIGNSFTDVKFEAQSSLIKLRNNCENNNGLIRVSTHAASKGYKVKEEMDCHISNNSFYRFHARGEGRLDLFAPNSIGVWETNLESDESKNLEWSIGPKLKIDYYYADLPHLQIVRRGFVKIYKKSIEREDKLQQKYIKNELARIEFHMFRATARNWSDWLDLIPRTLLYIAKHNFADRYIIVKFLLWTVAVSVAVVHALSAIDSVLESGIFFKILKAVIRFIETVLT